MKHKIGDKVIINNVEYTIKYCSGYLWYCVNGKLKNRVKERENDK